MDNMGKLLLSGDGRRNRLHMVAHVVASIAILVLYYFTWGVGFVLFGVTGFFIL